MKALVIVESPAKAKTIGKYLGKNYVVKASLGHIKDLPKSKLGVDEANFQATFNIIKDKTKIVKELKDSAKGISTIYLATDPDREGEAISYHLAQLLQDEHKKIFRVLLHEITEKSVKEAIKNPSSIDQNKVDAQYARRILDRLVGYKISPLLWEKIKRGLSAGRVQSVALRLICEREKEINAFKPEEYWNIDAQFSASEPPPFVARLTKKDNKKITVRNQLEAEHIVQEVTTDKFVVKDITKKEKVRHAPPPFITSKLQQEASRRLRLTVKKAMQIAQKLYEGIDLGSGEREGLITYMRTDSMRVSNEALAEVRNFVSHEFGKDYLPSSPNYFKNKKSSQDAHEAIRPTSVLRTPEMVKKILSREEYNLYEMIWQRFVASQMNPYKFLETKVSIGNGPYLFEAKGDTPLFQGYLKVYREESPDEPDNNNKNEETKTVSSKLPPLTIKEILNLIKLTHEQKFTQPPPRYTEATLVKELEDKEIGRPSTYASIVYVLQDRNYVIKKEGKFHPTDLGMLVVEKLVQNFHELMDIQYTAHMENKLDDIEEGKRNKIEILTDFYQEFSKELESAKINMDNIKEKGVPSDLACPKCSTKNVVQKWGRYGCFYECTNESCKHHFDEHSKDPITSTIIVEEKCPKCGSNMVVKNGKYGQFLACDKYPTCKTTMPFNTGKDLGTCPKCSSPLVEKRSKYGKFIACSSYPECKYIAGQETFPCPVEGCGGSLTRKRTKNGKFFYGCTNYPKCTQVSWTKPA